MKVSTKQHGYFWFFKGEDVDEDYGFPNCPECGNTGLDDNDELTTIDMGLPKKVNKNYTIEFKCLKCGYHAVFERSEKEILEANEE